MSFLRPCFPTKDRRPAVRLTVTQSITVPPSIRFDATLSTIDTSTVSRLPDTSSKDLPSRGQVAVRGTINGVEFQTVLEPDGNRGHWMRVDDTLQQAAGISAGDTATLDPPPSPHLQAFP